MTAVNGTGLVVEVFTDPSCPWAWITSRWLKEVAPHRNLELRWRSYSLEIRDAGELPAWMPEDVQRVLRQWAAESHRALRVFEALRADGNEEAIDALYTEWGRRSTELVGAGKTLFVPGRPPPTLPEGMLLDCLQACRLDPELYGAADDLEWDVAIIESMEEACAFGGLKTQTPTVVLRGDPPRGLKGPVMSPAPTGERALRLWDAFRIMADEPGFLEVTRPRQMPSLPEVSVDLRSPRLITCARATTEVSDGA